MAAAVVIVAVVGCLLFWAEEDWAVVEEAAAVEIGGLAAAAVVIVAGSVNHDVRGFDCCDHDDDGVVDVVCREAFSFVSFRLFDARAEMVMPHCFPSEPSTPAAL